MYKAGQHIHFVGIGGIGMSGIAELLINLGHKVSGSDLRESDITRRLADMGAQIQSGHHPDYVKGVDAVVVSSAVSDDNPELLAAVSARIPVIPRAEMLAELMRLKYGIAIAGAHGKTSCTSMVAVLLAAGGLDPTVVVGGKLEALGSNARLGRGEFLVAEADESDGSFNRLTPVVVVVTNMDREHMDHYGSDEALDQAFVEFMNKVPFYGASILCLDDSRLASLIPKVRKRVITYGTASQADFQARDIKYQGVESSFTLFVRGEKQGTVNIPVPGRHNVLNCLGALAASCELGVDTQKAMESCVNFGGVKRRFELKGRHKSGALVMDDYAHHPTEIKATLEAARNSWPDKRIVILFQPHRFSRTRLLFDDFATSFYGADQLFVMDIYAASEKKDPEISAEKLTEAIKEHGHRNVEYVGKKDKAKDHLEKILGPNDVVFTMGAGDVFHLGEDLVTETD